MLNIDNPLVSIVLPVYNGEKYLAVSIESCIRQTYSNWELLIMDDGSVDRSAEIAKQYESKDARIHYYKNPQNLRLPRTLNRGFELSKGNYLTWTSDDNYYEETAIEKMVQSLQSGEKEFVFASCRIINDKDEEIGTITAPKEYRHAIWDYDFVGACFMYTRHVYESVGEYDPDLFLCEDYDYWLRVFAQFEVTYIDEFLYVYRVHDKMLSVTHKEGQYKNFEKTLLKNFQKKENASTLDRFYLYRGLHRSRTFGKTFIERNYYLPKLLCYKVWHKLFVG